MMETESNNSLPAFFNHSQATSYSIESKIESCGCHVYRNITWVNNVKEANKVQVETQ